MASVSNNFYIPALGDDDIEESLRNEMEDLGLSSRQAELGGDVSSEIVHFIFFSLGVLAHDVASGLATDLVKSALGKTAAWVRRNRKGKSRAPRHAADIYLYNAESGQYIGRAEAIFSENGSICFTLYEDQK